MCFYAGPSRPLQRELKVAEIILNQADGLDWNTLCRVDAMHFALKSGLREQRGLVCTERRRFICQRMLQLFPFEFRTALLFEGADRGQTTAVEGGA